MTIPRMLAAQTFVIAVLAVTGWACGSAVMKSIIPGAIPMHPITAFALGAAALAVVCYTFDDYLLNTGFSMIVCIMGILKLLAIFTKFDVGLDALFFRDRLGFSQMPPNTALLLVALGVAMASVRMFPRGSFMLCLPIAYVSASALIGYFIGIPSLYTVGEYVPMAMNAALCLLMMASAVAILALKKSEVGNGTAR